MKRQITTLAIVLSTAFWATQAWGGGSEHSNVYGGETAGRYGEGAYHEAPSGATAWAMARLVAPPPKPMSTTRSPG